MKLFKRKISLIIFVVLTYSVFAAKYNPLLNKNAEALIHQASQLGFQENKGQMVDTEGKPATAVLFKAEVPGLNIWLTTSGLTYQFLKIEEEEKELKFGEQKIDGLKGEWHKVDMILKGAQIKKENIFAEGDITEGEVNYYLGHCPKGILDVKTFSKITIKNVYKGIDWVLYTNNGIAGSSLKYDFIIHPNADANQIKLIYEGSGRLEVLNNQIHFENPIGEMDEGKLYCYQGSETNEINSSYIINKNIESTVGSQTSDVRHLSSDIFSYEIGIQLNNYDKSKELIIDPQLVWATFFGGNVNDGAYGIDTDTNGDVYVSGYSNSTNYPVTAGAYQGVLASANLLDIICIKFNSAGQRQWATYFGGNQNDEGRSLCISGGTAYIFGYSDSNTIPTINSGGYFQAASAGGRDAFLLAISSGGFPAWATFMGGGAYEWGHSIFADQNGNIFVTGETQSDNFPQVNPGGTAYVQGARGGSSDIFVSKFNNTNTLVWSTYVGGNAWDLGSSICTDLSGNIYVAGYAGSTSFFPFVNPGGGAYYQTSVGFTEACILKFNSGGTMLWSTYLGGSASDLGSSIRCDAFGNVFLIGSTESLNFPTLNPGGGAYFQGPHAGGNTADAFITKFSSAGVMLWNTFYGGTNPEGADKVKIDTCNNVYVSLTTGSYDIPTYNAGGCAAGYFDPSYNGNSTDGFLLKFSNTGVRLWATYFGGIGTELNIAIALDKNNSLFATGEWILAPSQSESTYPILDLGAGAYYDATKNGSDDSYIAKFISVGTTYTQSQTNNTGCSGCNGTATINVGCGNGLYNFTWSNGSQTFNSTNPTNTITGLCAGTYTVTATNACSAPVTATFTITSSGGAPVVSSQAITICPGDSYTLPGGGVISSAGSYIDTVLASNGCDSIITTTVTLSPPITTSINKQICPGQSVTLPGGGTANAPGIYKDTLTSSNGCDSIITTIITQVNALTSSQNPNICSGNNFTLPDGSIVNAQGIYIDTLLTTAGCDSIITTNLTVLSNSTFSQSPTICSGNNFTLPGGTVVTASGIYVDTILSSNGCDSVITTTLAVLPNAAFTQSPSICNGASYLLPGGNTVSASGTYIDTIASGNGCDSIITTNLSVVSAVTFSQNPVICIGSTYTLPGGAVVSTSGIYVDTLVANGGCDSIITTNLSIVNAILNTVSPSICSGNTYTLPGGAVVSASGTYVDTLLSFGGCDSIITTNLSVINTSTFTQAISICIGQSYVLPGGTTANTTGTYIDTVTSSKGCDSIITTNLSTVSAILTNQNPVLCIGGSYALPGGAVVSAAGTYVDTLTASGGCDSIITTNLIITPNSTSAQSASFCVGGSYTLPGGTVVTSSGVYYDTLTSAAGCDSIITSTVTVYPLPVTAISSDITILLGQSTTLTASGGGSYSWSPSTGLDNTTTNSVVANPKETTTYCVVVVSPNGCIDSSCVTVNVEIPCPTNETLDVPNAFSPNGDNVNDEFCLQGWDICIENFSIVIFDRWGEKVFESKDPNFCWDGKFRGTTMDAQVFVYYIKANFSNSEKPIVRKGNISLLR